MKEEYWEIKEDNNEEWHKENNSERGEDPQEVFQKAQVVLELLQAGPLFPHMKQTHL